MAKKLCAAFTIAQDEPRFLPLWATTHDRVTRANALYLLDHASDENGSNAWPTYVHRVPVYNDESFDHTWLRQTVEAFQRFLLKSYEWVLFTEADEMAVLLGRDHPGGLADFIAGLPEGTQAVTLSGYEVVHRRDQEPGLDWFRPVMQQRRWWAPSELYSKTVLARVPMDWDLGFHTYRNRPVVHRAESLRLLHLHRVDYDYCRGRHEARLRRRWSEEDLAAGRGFQSRIVDPAEFDRWFYRPEQWPALEPLRLEPVPEEWRCTL